MISKKNLFQASMNQNVSSLAFTFFVQFTACVTLLESVARAVNVTNPHKMPSRECVDQSLQPTVSSLLATAIRPLWRRWMRIELQCDLSVAGVNCHANLSCVDQNAVALRRIG